MLNKAKLGEKISKENRSQFSTTFIIRESLVYYDHDTVQLSFPFLFDDIMNVILDTQIESRPLFVKEFVDPVLKGVVNGLKDYFSIISKIAAQLMLPIVNPMIAVSFFKPLRFVNW